MRGEIVLSDTLIDKYVQVKVVAKDFEEAILKATKPLLDDGAVEQTYIDKIIDIYRNTGPYIVITEHVALPHAPSEFGANKLAIGLTILNEAVMSGHNTNDPVKFLFSLSSPDQNQHLESLSALVQLLAQSDFLEELETANSVEEVLNIVKAYEKG